MAKIISVASAEGSGTVRIGIAADGGKTYYTVTPAAYSAAGEPAVGDILEGDALEDIENSDRYVKAKKKALSLLSYSDNSLRNLTAKLCRAGFDRRTVAAVTEEMVQLGYVDEERQLERLVLDEANRSLHGPSRIMRRLVANGYPASKVRSTLSRLCDEGEISFEENSRRLIEKKLPDEADEEQIEALLYKYGYKT